MAIETQDDFRCRTNICAALWLTPTYCRQPRISEKFGPYHTGPAGDGQVCLEASFMIPRTCDFHSVWDQEESLNRELMTSAQRDLQKVCCGCLGVLTRTRGLVSFHSAMLTLQFHSLPSRGHAVFSIFRTAQAISSIWVSSKPERESGNCQSFSCLG